MILIKNLKNIEMQMFVAGYVKVLCTVNKSKGIIKRCCSVC